MKLFKSTLAILMALLMVFSLAACGEKEPATDDGGNTSKTDKVEGFKETKIELDACTINVLGCEKIKDYDEKPAIRVWFDVTNTSDETCYTNYNYEFTATQDGYELTETSAYYEIAVDAASTSLLEIRPGVTIRTCEEYNFKEDGGTITIGFNNYYSEEEPKTIEFDPKNLPGAPKDEFVAEKVSDPQWVKDLKSEGVYDAYDVKYDIKIEKCEFVEGYEGEKLIRVYYDFKNNSDEEETFSSNVTHSAFQDGIELSISYPKEKVAEDENYSVEVEPGKSIKLAYSYELRSDSPVEIDLRDLNGTGVGTVYEVK